MILIRKKAALFLALIFLAALLPALVVQAGAASVEGVVFADGNENGVQDRGEKPLDRAEITLIKSDGQSESIVKQTHTNDEGYFLFDALDAGDYYLQVSLPVDYNHVFVESDGALMFPAQGRHSRTSVFSLSQDGKHRQLISAGKRSAYITITAFGDLNMNGGRMSSEPRLKDVEVDLLFTHDEKDYVIAQGKTGSDGILQIWNLTPATYKIRATLPSPYIVGPLGAKFNPFYNVIHPQEGNVGTSDPFTLVRSQGMGIGGVMASSLSGRIWMDSNMNGAEDAGEGGCQGMILTLTHLSMDVTKTMTTTQDAPFLFENLQAGEYSLTAELPDGVMFALPGSPSVFHDGYAQSQTVNIQVLEDRPAVLSPIGVMPASSIRLTAFLDSNVNGLLDEGEPPFMNAKAELISNGQVMASATTDAQGQVYFPRVRDGEVTIRVSLPDGQVFTIDGGNEGNAFSSLSASSTLETVKTLQKGETLSLYAGATLPGSITGTLFEDKNLNGQMDPDEAGLSGFAVAALDQAGNVAAEAVTDNDGNYTLFGLVPAQYKVRFALISPYVFSKQAETASGIVNKIVSQTVAHGETDVVTVGPGAAVENMDAGAFRSAVIMGAVLLGDEETGFSEQAQGLPGVQIKLLDEIQQDISEYTIATTDEAGRFSLKGALPGTYYLSYTLPEDAKFSQPMTDDTTLITEALSVKASDELAMSPLYAVKTGTVSGQAFHDVNNNALFDQDDMPLGQVSIEFVNNRTGESYQAKSDENGLYEIKGIRPGAYTATVAAGEGYAIDENDKGLVPADITGQSSKEYAIKMGDRIEGALIPALKPIVVSGNAFYDNDLSKSLSDKDNAFQAQLTLTHLRTGSTVTLDTDETGRFVSENVFPGVYQLSLALPADHLLIAPEAEDQNGTWTAQVTLDEDNANLELAVVQLGRMEGAVWNMDGSQKDIGGLEIRLLDENDALIQQTTTGADGKFAFLRLMPISYRLSVNLPEAYRFARQLDTAIRPSVILSDLVGMDSSSGQSELIKLNMGEKKTEQDIGMGAMGKLGDYAWLDLDKDGMQDSGEPGIPGLVIKLYQYNQLTNETTTDQYGRYLFDKLFPGNYTLVVEMPSEIKPTVKQTEFLLVASVLSPTEDTTARAENIVVPSGGRNLNADLGFVLRKDGVLPESLKNLPVKDWTRINEQNPRR